MNPSDLIIPLLLAGACGTGRRVNVYAALTRGAEDGLTVLLHVIPALVGLLTAVSMFRASGAMDALARLCAPVLNLLGIPAETVPLMLVRPVSGSGALAVALSEGRELGAAARFAAAASSIACTRIGAQRSIPQRREVDSAE